MILRTQTGGQAASNPGTLHGERSAFDTDDLLYGIGVGGSVLVGLLRMDLSHGLEGPTKEFRIDFYLDALM